MLAISVLNYGGNVTGSATHRLGTIILGLLAVAPLCAQTGGAAKVLQMAGQVSVLHDGNPWALNAGDVIQPEQIVITGPDGYAIFRVADGSTFDVFPNARVVFRNNHGDWKDLLEIILGKVKVSIQHFGGQPNNYKVRTATAVIAVRGTVFDVDVEDMDATTLVVVEEGRVEVSHLVQPGKTSILNPGDSIRVFKNQPLAARAVDRGMIYQKMMRAASDAMNQILLHQGTSAPGSTASSGSSSGDKNKNPVPTGNPPPPPPPH